MFSFLKKKSVVPSPTPVPPSPSADTFADRFTKCTFCGGTKFYEGPSGGASQNIECSNCGARFNIHLIPGGPFFGEVIRQPIAKEKQ